MSRQRAKYILDHRDLGVDDAFLKNFVFNTQRLSTTVPGEHYPSREEIIQNILLQWSPRIDTAVTIDLRRILRLPGSLHGQTGKKVKLLDYEEIDFFDRVFEESSD